MLAELMDTTSPSGAPIAPQSTDSNSSSSADAQWIVHPRVQ